MHSEKTKTSELIYGGKIVKMYRDTALLENGREAVREVCRVPDACAILVRDGDGMIMETQYRYAHSRELLEIPAGKLEPGETPEDGARRELAEETGISCGELIPLGSMIPSAAVLSERIYVYYTKALEVKSASPDEDEFLSVKKYPISEIEDMIRRGEISDAKTVFAFCCARLKGLI